MRIETIGNLEEVTGEVLKTCMEPQNEVDKYAVAVADNENNVTGHLPKEKSGKYAKTIFYFLKTDPLNICHNKITGKAKSYKLERQQKDENPLSTTIHWEL